MKPSIVKTCGFAVLSQLPVGCVPLSAEPLTSEERQLVENALDVANLHIDLLEGIVAHSRPLVAFNNAEPTSTTLRGEWKTAIDRGYKMLDGDLILAINEEDFIWNGEDMEVHGQAYTFRGEHNETIVLARNCIRGEYNCLLESTLMHEIEHLEGAGPHHGDLKETNEHSLSDVVESRDIAYRDSLCFMLAYQIFSDTTNVNFDTNQTIEYIRNAQDPAAEFETTYRAWEVLQLLMETNRNEWAAQYGTYWFKGDTHGGGEGTTELEHVRWRVTQNYRTFFASTYMLTEFRILQGEWIEILQSDAADALFEAELDKTRTVLESLRAEFPEYFRELLRRELPIDRVAQQPIRRLR